MTDNKRNDTPGTGSRLGRFTAIKQKIPKLPLDGLKRRLGKDKDSAPGPGKKKRKKLGKKQIILLSAGAVVLCVGVYFLVDLFTEEELAAVTGEITYGSLTQDISGTGTTTPADSVTYSLPSSEAEVTGWYVEAGDTVEEGDLLFEQDDSEVDEIIAEYEYEILEYEIEIDEARESLTEAQEGLAGLTVTAPFSGRVTEITVEAGDSVSNGMTLAYIADTSAMEITQYFSYIYESEIYEGMEAAVSVPDSALSLTGTVTDISYVSYTTSTGLECFAVTVRVESPPASLTDGVSAEAWLTGSDGSEIYPAEGGSTLEYANKRTITSEATGTVSAVYVTDYENVSSGATLFTIDSDSYETQIESLENQIETYESLIEELNEDIADAEESREDYKRYAEISGRVITADYTEMRDGTVTGSVVIYDLTSMTITVNFDELDVDQLSEGMSVTVYRETSDETEMYEAEITYISLEASNSNGVATFEGGITIYSEGELSAGVNVSYYVDVSGESEGLLAPVSAVRSYEDGYYLIVQSDSRPDSAIDVDEDYPSGYYAVPVEIGASNEDYVVVTSGVEEGDTVFLRYQESAPSGGDETSSGGDTDTGGDTGGFSGGSMPNFGGGGMGGGGMGGGMPGG